MGQTIRFVDETGESCAVRPWFGRQSRDVRAAQDAARRAARTARQNADAKVFRASDADRVDILLNMVTTD